MMSISAEVLKERIITGREYALIDVRTEGAFAKAHLLFAVSVPLDRLELKFDRLVPRLDTPIVLCDDGSQLAEQAAERLDGFGYSRIEVLEGGIQGWRESGYEIFSGINVPSKAFGEFVEKEYGTPRLTAAEIKTMIDAGEKIVILDSRPMKEFRRMNIPGALCCPGAELVYRVTDAAIDPDTMVIVNCAGRTRSIIGCQSLINAGVPNRVAALKDGTMGWHLAGFTLEHGQSRTAPPVSEKGLQQAREMAEEVGNRAGVRRIQASELSELINQARERSLFLLDVRSPEEFENGHLLGSCSAPGGQLVQATDEYVGVRNARLVLIDDTGVRATMTASWLLQMGWEEVYVLEGGLEDAQIEKGPGQRRILGLEKVHPPKVSAKQLHTMNTENRALVLDLADSLEFREGHIPGARRASRLELVNMLEGLKDDREIVLCSADGTLATLSAVEAANADETRLNVLEGGTEAWYKAGLTLEEGDEPGAGELEDDVWYRPYERTDAVEDAMKAYLSWEVALVEQIKRDKTTRFRSFDF